MTDDELVVVDPELVGLTILDVFDFVHEGTRWRQLTLSNGTLVQLILTGPWLVLTPAYDP